MVIPLAEKSPQPLQSTEPIVSVQELINSLEGIVWEGDAQTLEFLFVSSQAERLLGYPPERWLHEKDFWQTHIYPADRDWAIDYCLRATAELRDHEFEYRMIAADGRLVWLRDIVTLVIEDGRATKLRGVMIDITAQKQSGALLASQNRVLEMIARGRSLADTLAVITQSIEEQTSNMLCSILLLDKNNQTLHEGAAPHLPASYSQVIDGMSVGPAAGSCGTAACLGETVIVTDIAIDPLWANYRELALAHGLRACWSTPIFSSDKQVLGTFAMYYPEPRHPTAQDFQLIELATNLAGIAIERTQAEQALLASKERFNAFMDHSPVLAFIKDEEGRYLYGNRSWVNQFGGAVDQWVGKTDFDLWPVEAAQNFRNSDLKTISSGENTESLVIEAQNGEPVRYWSELKFLLNDIADRRLIGGLALDITEHKQLEEQLRQAQKMEAIGRLAGGVAHDFNNLLTVINGYSDLLLQQFSHDNSVRPDLEQIRKAGERAATLTRQLLAFSRQQLLQPQILDLNEVVADLGKMLLRLIGEHIELVTHLQPELGLIKADRGQLEQVVMNLVLNARDAMPQGGRLVIETMNVSLDQEYNHQHPDVRPGPYVLLAVGDTGHGMDTATINHIFEPFFTTKEVGQGTGLGLATVYGIVAQSDGHLQVFSQVGRGTIFNLYFPQVDQTSPLPEPEMSAPESGPEGKTVLLVEDDTEVRLFVRVVLESNGYTVLEANNGPEGLALSQQYHQPIHLLLTEAAVTPYTSGRALAEPLLATRPELRLLYISGATDNGTLKQAGQECGVTFLQKPFSPHTLVYAVRGALNKTTN